MFIIKHKIFFLTFSVILAIASFAALFTFGLKPGIDFKGGAIVTAVYTNTVPEAEQIKSEAKNIGLGEVSVQASGEKEVIVKTRILEEKDRPMLAQTLSVNGAFPYTEKSFSAIGPSISKDLTAKSILAVILVSIAIIIFITFAFREVSKPVASWKYGLIAITTLLHDIIIPAGLYAYLGYAFGAEVDTLFVVALLTILGVSISDTIVIFDRIRENLKKKISQSFEEVVGASLSQSFTRSINTSLTVIIVLLALFFFGPEPTKWFALTLVTGMIVGTYSSIFVASPLLTLVEKRQRANK
ncbi:MAG: protein translocase subunit SecF [Minisyncoccia bacterium]